MKLMRTQIAPKYDKHLIVLLKDIPGINTEDYEIVFYNVCVDSSRTDTFIGVLYDEDNPAWTYALMQMDSLDAGFERMIERMRNPC